MLRFENKVVSREECPVKLGPIEWENSLRYTQNVLLQDLDFINCEFIGAGLATYGEPVNRSTARNIRMKNCVMNSFFGNGAIFDDVTIDGLRTRGAPVILFGSVLRHVVLTGKCGRFLFNRNISHDDKRRNAAFDAANVAFYEQVDWALDISTVKASVLEIRGSIPSRLIRRNPEEHFIMTRAVAQASEWKRYEPFSSFDISISTFLKSGADDNLFVAERQSRIFKQKIEYYHRMKAAGLVT